MISDMLVEASLYIKVEFADATSSMTFAGFKVHLTADKELASDVLKFIVGHTAELVFGLDDPYGIVLGDAMMDDVYLGVTVYS